MQSNKGLNTSYSINFLNILSSGIMYSVFSFLNEMLKSVIPVVSSANFFTEPKEKGDILQNSAC